MQTQFIVHSLAIGVCATAVLDLWQFALQQLGVAPLNFALLGRWAGHLARGTWAHESIAKAAPIEHEVALGWIVHYATGVGFAALLLLACGSGWVRSPSIAPALAIGIGTVVVPLLVMQPAMGAGVAFARTPRPLFNSLKSVVNHTVFGLGLYVAGYFVSAYSVR